MSRWRGSGGFGDAGPCLMGACRTAITSHGMDAHMWLQFRCCSEARPLVSKRKCILLRLRAFAHLRLWYDGIAAAAELSCQGAACPYPLGHPLTHALLDCLQPHHAPTRHLAKPPITLCLGEDAPLSRRGVPRSAPGSSWKQHCTSCISPCAAAAAMMWTIPGTVGALH